MKLFILYENAAGLALFRYKKYKESKLTVDDVLALAADEAKFMKKVKPTPLHSSIILSSSRYIKRFSF